MSAIKEYIALIENAVKRSVPETKGHLDGISDMLFYSLESGGKRVRPLLCLEFAQCCGAAAEKALDYAVAVEYIHTYSLVHDDLPCMDDDDFRRGKPSSHKKYGEANALLAGDALLTHAFNILASAPLSAEQNLRAVKELSALAGVNGMIGGQYIDLAYENKEADADVLFTMDALKTAALIEAACVLGCVSAGADEEKISNARKFALNLGLAFQITDDILDFISEEKSSDEIKGKSTYTSIFGPEKARELAAEYTEKAISALEFFGDSANEIKLIAGQLLNRNN